MFGRKKSASNGAHLKENTVGTSNEISFDVLDAARSKLDSKERDPKTVKVKSPGVAVGVVSLLFSKISFTKNDKPTAGNVPVAGDDLLIGDKTTGGKVPHGKIAGGKNPDGKTSSDKDLDGEGPSSKSLSSKNLGDKNLDSSKSRKAEKRAEKKKVRSEAKAVAKQQRKEKRDSRHSLYRAENAGPYSKDTAQAEIERRKKIRHRRRVRLAVLACLACVIALGMAGSYAYHQYRLHNDQNALMSSAIEEIRIADENIVLLDGLVSDPMEEADSNDWSTLHASYSEVESHLSKASKISEELLSVLDEGEMRSTADQVIYACDARNAMLESAESMFAEAPKANGLAEKVKQWWASVLAADSVAREGSALVSSSSIDSSMSEAQEKLAQAQTLFENAISSLNEIESADEGLDLSKEREYLEKRFESLGYAKLAAQALTDRNKEEASKQAQLYNQCDSDATELASELPSDMIDPVKSSFEKSIASYRKKYEDARYAANAADGRIREYLGV